MCVCVCVCVCTERKRCDISFATVVTKLAVRYNVAHSPTFPSLYLRHSSFSNTSVALTTP